MAGMTLWVKPQFICASGIRICRGRGLCRVIYSILTIVMVFAVIAKFLVPEGITAVSEFTAIRAEAQKTTLLQDDAKSPDELIAEYRKISSQIESRINVEVSASGILRSILETAAAATTISTTS